MQLAVACFGRGTMADAGKSVDLTKVLIRLIDKVAAVLTIAG
jgi:hypothetical protein